jgi:hypothetical protein
MSSIDINKLSCGGSGYIEQVIESVKKSILEGCIIWSPDPCGLQSQNKRMYINHLKSPLLILLLHDILFHSINR